MGIIFCQMAMNRLSESKVCVERYLPYVDHVVLIDGGSSDDSIFYFRNLEKEEPKFHFFVRAWTDKFYEQRTEYLRKADLFAKEGDYILVSDPDEWFEDSLLSNIGAITKVLQDNKCNVAAFQSRSVSLRGNKRVWENLDDYWKHLLYRWEPGMHYVGNPHETMVIPSEFKMLKTPFVYEHIKQENVIWHRGARNFVVWGTGRTSVSPEEQTKMSIWNEFTEIRKKHGIPLMWHDFDKYLLKGNVNKDLKLWMEKYKDVSGFEFSSEIGEVYKLYFDMYHPEEKEGAEISRVALKEEASPEGKEQITLVTITQNRVDNLKRNLPKCLPYVDRVVIIDGGSSDGTELYCKSLGEKVEWYFHKWEDSFAKQWNNYLRYINRGWVFLLDDDELPSDELLLNLRKIIDESNQGESFSCVEFRSWSINPNDNPPKDHPDDYWRKLLFRYNPGMRYVVNLHQCLVGYQNNNHARSNLIYYHIKTPKDVARNACRNYFIEGIWPSGVTEGIKTGEWHDFKRIVGKHYPNVETFNDLDGVFIAGNVHEELQDWIIEGKSFGNSMYHELHHYFEYYFEMLHPEEITAEVERKLSEQKERPKKFYDIAFSCKEWNAKNDSRKLGVPFLGVEYELNGERTALGLVSPSLELIGFNGVETSGALQFAWSQGESTVRIHGIDDFPESLLVKFMWDVPKEAELFIEVRGKKIPVAGTGLQLNRKKD